MSGIKTTSIFGSIINYLLCKLCLEVSNATANYICVLGDDLDLQIAELSKA